MRLKQMGKHWGQMMRLGLNLGIMPRDFWQLSLCEWMLLTRANIPALSRSEFENLAKEFDNDTR